MEQYFEITKDSKHYQQYINYQTKRKEAIEATSKFMKEHDIPGSKFMLWEGYLWVPETSEIMEKFGKQFRDVCYKGCRAFKKNSVIGRAFAKADIHMPPKPFVMDYFHDMPWWCGQINTRLFMYKDKLYCSIAVSEYPALVECPQGFIEMKASEFFKVIEEAESEQE